MIKKVIFTVGGLIVTMAVIIGVYALMIMRLIASGANFQPPAVAVSITEVRQDEWETVLPAVGSVVAVQGITVSAEADGVVRDVAFEAGSIVKAGDLLVQLDIDVEQTQLRAAEAGADLARANYKRAQELFDSRTISKAELDSAEAALKQAQAQTDNIRAMIAKKTVRAPFAGRLGIRQISLGQFLNKGQAVVSLQAFDPVYVEFSLPQQNLSRLEEGLNVRVTTDAFPGEVFKGRLTALNPNIDPATRNLRMQATFANADGRLRPGMFASVEVVLPEKRQVFIVPATAVVYATYGNSVFVVEEQEGGPDGSKILVARQRLVRVGQTRGDYVVISSGLKAGERIVKAGAFKLTNGATVVESDIGVPEPSLTPEPQDA